MTSLGGMVQRSLDDQRATMDAHMEVAMSGIMVASTT
jgi:hypothetical protein